MVQPGHREEEGDEELFQLEREREREEREMREREREEGEMRERGGRR